MLARVELPLVRVRSWARHHVSAESPAEPVAVASLWRALAQDMECPEIWRDVLVRHSPAAAHARHPKAQAVERASLARPW
jgi:hypothetical protein